MLNIRRIPGVLYTHKLKTLTVTLITALILHLLHHWNIVCTNYHTKKQVEKLCSKYRRGDVMGSLCSPLCTDHMISTITCTAAHAGKELVFIAKWHDVPIVFKSSNNVYGPAENIEQFQPKGLWGKEEPQHHKRLLLSPFQNRDLELESFPRHFPKKTHLDDNSVKVRRKRKPSYGINFNDLSEKDFDRIIRDIVANRLNLSLSNEQLDSLKYLQSKNRYIYDENSMERRVEKGDIYHLLQSQEFLLSSLFAESNVFPQILGTCGHYFAVEHFNTPRMTSAFAKDDKKAWVERMKLAILMMDLIEELETSFPDVLHLCDIKMEHFGLVPNGQHVKFLDLDTVYTNNVIERLLASNRPCKSHQDCDMFDCKSLCNSETKLCDSGLVNNNLQVLCEKIFIGWTLSGKMIVPGLLMTEHTPPPLAALLRMCAENGRAPVPEDIRQKLYTTLTEMEQALQ